MGGDGPNMLFRANVDKDITQRKVFGQNKVSLKGKNMSDAPLIINVFEISQMKNSVEVLGRLKRAIEEVFNADGEKFEGARCEFNKKKFPIELLVFVAGKEFARVTLEGATAYFLKNGEKKALGNGHSFTQEETFTKLLAELAALKGVKVELHGLGMY